MTSQSKNISSKGGQRRRSSGLIGGTGTGAVAGAGVGAGAGAGSNSDDIIKTTKNTRKRVHQKRTRNTTRPKTIEDKVKPVLESTNPFFIAVCAPDTYKPAVVAEYGSGGHGNRNGGGSGTGSGSGAGSNRRDVSSQQRRMPNVFLRSNSRNSSYSSSSVSNGTGMGGGMGTGMGAAPGPVTVNPFIHHPVIQNDRHRGDTSTSTSTSNVNHYSTVSSNRTGTNTNIYDKEQFPSLGSSGSSVNIVHTKLNFKEMVLKTSSGTGVCSVESVSTVNTPPPPPKVRAEYAQQSQKVLSTGNIFLGAFYGSRDNQKGRGDGDCDGDADADGNGEVGGDGTRQNGSFISSVLIDSCDRKYDNLYR
jgi:hypothetical protein